MHNETLTPSIKKEQTTLTDIKNRQFVLPALPYSYDALEPYIDKKTMEIHHKKHHAAYVKNFNIALESVKDVPSSLEEIIKNISYYPLAVRNNCGGHYNHTLFWRSMRINGEGKPTGKFKEEIDKNFGSIGNFKSKFSEVALKHFASGWAWLVLNNGKLEIGTTPNHDNPLMDISTFKGTPILCLDLWEHAYYLKYQNRREEYISNWWGLVNWEEASRNYLRAK